MCLRLLEVINVFFLFSSVELHFLIFCLEQWLAQTNINIVDPCAFHIKRQKILVSTKELDAFYIKNATPQTSTKPEIMFRKHPRKDKDQSIHQHISS